ncbi:MAG TPA: DUF1232 domain-containing protein [Burkholderiales bacterium]|nr:DUF1232 domain-containing protein [Burkholderiales bacterium]
MWERLRDGVARLRREALALWFAIRDPRTPLAPKILAALIVAYALSPIDLIPDFIPVLGYLDELLLLPGLIWLVIRMVPVQVMKDSRAKAVEWFATGQGMPRSRLGAVMVIAIWVVLAWWLISIFARSLGKI